MHVILVIPETAERPVRLGVPDVVDDHAVEIVSRPLEPNNLLFIRPAARLLVVRDDQQLTGFGALDHKRQDIPRRDQPPIVEDGQPWNLENHLRARREARAGRGGWGSSPARTPNGNVPMKPITNSQAAGFLRPGAGSRLVPFSHPLLASGDVTRDHTNRKEESFKLVCRDCSLHWHPRDAGMAPAGYAEVCILVGGAVLRKCGTSAIFIPWASVAFDAVNQGYSRQGSLF